jgi:hypothetical protein
MLVQLWDMVQMALKKMLWVLPQTAPTCHSDFGVINCQVYLIRETLILVMVDYGTDFNVPKWVVFCKELAPNKHF